MTHNDLAKWRTLLCVQFERLVRRGRIKMYTSESKSSNEKVMAEGGSKSQDDSATIIKKIDLKMGDGWAAKFANVLASGMTLEAEVTFVFEKFDGDGNLKYKSRRSA